MKFKVGDLVFIDSRDESFFELIGMGVITEILNNSVIEVTVCGELFVAHISWVRFPNEMRADQKKLFSVQFPDT